MKGAVKSTLVILFLTVSSLTSSAETLARRYGYEKLFNTGRFEQLSKSCADLHIRRLRAAKMNDYDLFARLSALEAEHNMVMGIYKDARIHFEASLDMFGAILQDDNDPTTLLLRYDYAATLALYAEWSFDNGADTQNQAIELYLKSSLEYAKCCEIMDKHGMGEFGIERYAYMLLQSHSIGFILTLWKHDYVTAFEHANSFQNIVEEQYGEDKTNHTEYVWALYQKATLYFRMGDYEKAMEYYQSAIKCSDSADLHDWRMRTTLLSELGNLYYTLNDLEVALLYFDRALEIFRDLGMQHHFLRAEVLSGSAMVYMNKGQWDTSAQRLDLAYRILVKFSGQDTHRAIVNRILYTYTYSATRDYLKALEELQQNLNKIEYFGDDTVINGFQWMFDLCLLLGKYDEMAQSEKSILKLQKILTNPSPRSLYTLYISMARNYELLQKSKKSCQYFNLAMGVHRQMIHKNFLFLPDRQRTLFWELDESRYRSIMRHGLYSESGSSSHSALLYDAALLQKGLLLEASIGLSRVIDENGTPELKEKMELLRLLMMSAPTEENVKAAQELEAELQQEAVKLGDFVQYTEITWKDIRDSLADDEVAIEFICINNGRTDVYMAEILRNNMNYPYHVEIKRGDSRFEWTRILPLLRPGDHVYFSPAGDLHKEGIEYLTLPDGQRMDEKYNMYRVSSTREVTKSRDRGVGKCSIALYGGLNYSVSQEDMEFMSMISGHRGEQAEQNNRALWSYLPGTEKEVEAIADLMKSAGYDCVTISGDYGVEDSFKGISGERYGIVHIATHGFYFLSDINVLNHSGLIFAGANNCWLNWSADEKEAESTNDGVLTSSEIADMNLLGTDLVVLSACNTAQGNISGEGVFGLQRAFKKAGVQSMLLSLSEVDDELTSRFMVSFYRHLTSGSTKREALRKAQDEIRKTTSGADPAVWSSFVLVD